MATSRTGRVSRVPSEDENSSVEDRLLTPELMGVPEISDLAAPGAGKDELGQVDELVRLKDSLGKGLRSLKQRAAIWEHRYVNVCRALDQDPVEGGIVVSEEKLRVCVERWLKDFGIGSSPAKLYHLLGTLGIRVPFKTGYQGFAALVRRVREELEGAVQARAGDSEG